MVRLWPWPQVPTTARQTRAFTFIAPSGFPPYDSHTCQTPWSVFRDGSEEHIYSGSCATLRERPSRRHVPSEDLIPSVCPTAPSTRPPQRLKPGRCEIFPPSSMQFTPGQVQRPEPSTQYPRFFLHESPTHPEAPTGVVHPTTTSERRMGRLRWQTTRRLSRFRNKTPAVRDTALISFPSNGFTYF